MNRVRAIAANKEVTKLFFNAKYDLRMLAKEGIEPKGPVIDVMLMARLLLPEEKRINLKHLARKFLKDPYIEELTLRKWFVANGMLRIKDRQYAKVPKHIIEPYAMADAKRLVELFFFLSGGIDQHNLWHVIEREMMLMKKAVLPMEAYGVHVDQAEVHRLTVLVKAEASKIKNGLTKLTHNKRFNPNSQTQVLSALAEEGVFRPTAFSLKTGKPKADVTSLLEYPSDIGKLVVLYRKITKAASTYLKNLTKPLLHVNFNQAGAKTGRFSSSGPNLQNIPRPKEDSLLGQIRRCFVARPGDRMVFIDYDQIELRLAAHFSQEKHMLKAIREGQDLHGKTCELVFAIEEGHPEWDLLRYLSKTLNFSVFYGTGPNKLRLIVLKQTDGKIRITLQGSSMHISTWKTKHPRVMKMFEDVAMEITKTGGVTNFYGRFVPVDGSKSYVGVNYKVQGTAADFMKLKMYAVCALLKGKKSRLMLTVHDELIFNVVKEEAYLIKQLKDTMEDHTTFSVPLTCSVSYGKNWQDKKKLKL